MVRALFSLFLFMAASSILPLSYEIHARLDVDSHSLDCDEEIVWTNTATIPARTLRLHLYLNAFADGESTMAVEAGSWLDMRAHGAVRFGRIDLHEVRQTEGDPLEYSFISPDDGNPADRTVMEVIPPRPVLPGDSISLHIKWTAVLPSILLRSGYAKDYFQVTQWYPKMGVFSDQGWNCHQYHISTEFFADYADYQVSLQIPRDYVLAATGKVTGRSSGESGLELVTIAQDSIHDFAWVCGKGLETTSLEYAPLSGHSILITLLMPGEYRYQEEEYIRAIKASMDHYARWVGPYPYDHFSIVVPPWHATRGSGGMEYPTMIIAATRHLLSEGNLDPAYVVAHEFGHQYFYGIVGSDEVEHPWLDEGLTTYTSARLMESLKPELTPALRIWEFPVSFSAFPMHPFRRINSRYYEDPKTDTMDTSGFRMANWPSYRANAYNRPAMALRTLENLAGEEVMIDILSTYAQRYAFSHPAPEDFIRIVGEKAGNSWARLFRTLVSSRNGFDLRVEDLKPTEALIVRTGDITLPVDITFTLSDGRRIKKRWNGQARWIRYRLNSDATFHSVEIDPDGILFLDDNPLNNSQRFRPARIAGFTFTRWILFTVQNVMEVASCVF
ncbi:MAG TPA: M1 family metallopeptidase [Thermoanaerobaculia bacterium]|nr:M1 family metallopeptidase [Thermoanaerobaculia bacterium]HUM29033.1 M1 family metallopeptidase [Thermoanaerobaculia bacterium]HXK67411.1 M1 family metallopeptidase [Thermoanaerobaculia bacterium]